MSVYFLRVGRYIKVGFSDNPERRMAKLWQSPTRYARPWDMSLTDEMEPLAVIDGTKDAEHDCHVALRDFSAGGEFFIDEPEVRDFIGRAQSGDLSYTPRPVGHFVAVGVDAMLVERREEIARMCERARAKAQVSA